jgi:hypothetical protein
MKSADSILKHCNILHAALAKRHCPFQLSQHQQWQKSSTARHSSPAGYPQRCNCRKDSSGRMAQVSRFHIFSSTRTVENYPGTAAGFCCASCCWRRLCVETTCTPLVWRQSHTSNPCTFSASATTHAVAAAAGTNLGTTSCLRVAQHANR